MHPAVKKALCETAGADRAWLQKIRPWYKHDDHFHIRLNCPPGSPSCVAQAPTACRGRWLRQGTRRLVQAAARQAANRPQRRPRPQSRCWSPTFRLNARRCWPQPSRPDKIRTPLPTANTSIAALAGQHNEGHAPHLSQRPEARPSASPGRLGVAASASGCGWRGDARTLAANSSGVPSAHGDEGQDEGRFARSFRHTTSSIPASVIPNRMV